MMHQTVHKKEVQLWQLQGKVYFSLWQTLPLWGQGREFSRPRNVKIEFFFECILKVPICRKQKVLRRMAFVVSKLFHRHGVQDVTIEKHFLFCSLRPQIGLVLILWIQKVA